MRTEEHNQRLSTECGGLMYCCHELLDGDGLACGILDLLPTQTLLQHQLDEATHVAWQSVAPAHTHETHYSRLELLDRDRTHEGLCTGYARLHLDSSPEDSAVLDIETW